jgi:GTP cyclohydrolase I
LIAEAIESNLQPAGVAIMIDAEHQCMTTRGVHHRHVSTITTLRDLIKALPLTRG